MHAPRFLHSEQEVALQLFSKQLIEFEMAEWQEMSQFSVWWIHFPLRGQPTHHLH